MSRLITTFVRDGIERAICPKCETECIVVTATRKLGRHNSAWFNRRTKRWHSAREASIGNLLGNGDDWVSMPCRGVGLEAQTVRS